MFKCLICGHQCRSGRGWKHHMTATHGSWNDEQYQAALTQATAEGSEGAMPYSTLEQAQQQAPESDRITMEVGAEKEPKERRPRKPKVSLEFAEDLAEMGKELAHALSNACELALFRKSPLNDREKTMLQEAWEAPLKVLNIVFNIQPLNLEATSAWWVMLFPMIALFVLVAHRGAEMLPDLIRAKLAEKKEKVEGDTQGQATT